MRQRFTLRLWLAIAGISLALCLSASAQQDKPREDFGSSLKRLKWDSKKAAAVEAKDKKNKKDKTAKKGEAPVPEADDVMRIETVLAATAAQCSGERVPECPVLETLGS